MAVHNDPPLSKFVYVIVTSRRARQLQAGAPPLLEFTRSQKHTRIAQEELEKGVLEYEMPDTGTDEDKEGKRRK